MGTDKGLNESTHCRKVETGHVIVRVWQSQAWMLADPRVNGRLVMLEKQGVCLFLMDLD